MPELAHGDVTRAGAAKPVKVRMGIDAVAGLAMDADAAGMSQVGETPEEFFGHEIADGLAEIL